MNNLILHSMSQLDTAFWLTHGEGTIAENPNTGERWFAVHSGMPARDFRWYSSEGSSLSNAGMVEAVRDAGFPFSVLAPQNAAGDFPNGRFLTDGFTFTDAPTRRDLTPALRTKFGTVILGREGELALVRLAKPNGSLPWRDLRVGPGTIDSWRTDDYAWALLLDGGSYHEEEV